MNLKLDDDQAPHRLQITWDQSVTMNASLLHVYNQNTDLIEPVQYDGAFWCFNGDIDRSRVREDEGNEDGYLRSFPQEAAEPKGVQTRIQ